MRANHRRLRDVDGAAAEPAFAIHQVIAPEVVERLAEPVELAARHRDIVGPKPALENLASVINRAI